MPSYELRPEAEADLEGIWRYSAKAWGIEQANNYIDELDGVFILLAGQPLLCREREEFNPPVRIHHHAHHLIIYQVIERGISIIRVLHESMHIDDHLHQGS